MSDSRKTSAAITVRHLTSADINDADGVYRRAFGTQFGLENPATLGGDSDLLRTRWAVDHTAVWGAYEGERHIGSNLAHNWGSVAFFGPLSVDPAYWNRGIAKHLLAPTLEKFAEWGSRLTGLWTFPESVKHVRLYQKFGFYPKNLVPVLAKTIEANTRLKIKDLKPVRLSQLPEAERESIVAACGALTDSIYEGLNLEREIRAVLDQKIGDVVLVFGGDNLEAFAVVHSGAGSEAGSGYAMVKFGAAVPGPGTGDRAEKRFDHLLLACEDYALEVAASRLFVGINVGREKAYRRLLKNNYRTKLHGLAMQTPNAPDYAGPDCWVIDDWR